MTMPRGASRALYAGNGQAAEFPFFFKVFEEDQLSVLITSPAGVTSEAQGWTAELDEGGGTVRYLHNGAPLPEGWKLAIMRDMPFVQEVDLITGTRFDPEVIETALDVATAERQQLLERLARAVVVEPTDEAGPEALLADIRDARSSAAASATSAQANANAAANSAQSAAGSAAIATEEREAACICAGEAKDARDVAIAQAEAANTLMEAELAKVNAIVAANRTDQQATMTAARAWAEKAADVPVEYDEEGNPLYSARHWAETAQKIAIEPPTAERRGAIRVGLGLHLETGANGETDMLAADRATEEGPGIVQPDGVTTEVTGDGLLSALGGNLRLNSEAWITTSGQWVAPLTAWYEVLLYGGGCGGYVQPTYFVAGGGSSGRVKSALVHLAEGQAVPVVIGAGAAGAYKAGMRAGGETTFGDLSTASGQRYPGIDSDAFGNASQYRNLLGAGGGLGGGRPYAPVSGEAQSVSNSRCHGAGHFGGGGAAAQVGSGAYAVGNGAQGSVRVRWHDPAKAAGPAPALLSARRMAPRAQGEPTLVNLYDPETGQGSVWNEADAEARLAEGLITEAAWLAICAEKATEERAAWLADPDSEAERFELLRCARDGRLAETDHLVAPDSPLTDAQRAAMISYRQSLRDLPAQEGAPWDGGGELTPWPAKPACCGTAPVAEESDAPCA